MNITITFVDEKHTKEKELEEKGKKREHQLSAITI
jgi:hypothetical protein